MKVINYKDVIAKRDAQCQDLLEKIKRDLPTLEGVLERLNTEWNGPDGYYRFYHGSFKVYHLQGLIRDAFIAIKWLMPDCSLHEYFMNIYKAGTSKEFDVSDNDNWEATTGPIVTAFLHCRYVLELMIGCGKRMEKTTNLLDSDWAAILYVYNLR